MAKNDEIDYVNKVTQIDNVPLEEFNDYLARKPFSDGRCGEYLMDIAQVMRLLPPPPAKLLDIGVGSGWTSELFARRGYEVLGLDISQDLINVANRRTQHNLSFAVCDYERAIPKGFHITIIYDSLHHAEDEYRVIRNVFESLIDGGILVTVEPGAGHSTTEESVEVMRKYGTTEKDMPYSRQHELMEKAGFGRIDQYTRLSQLPVAEISTVRGAIGQVRHALSLAYGSATGLTSIVLAVKSKRAEAAADAGEGIAEALLSLSVVHDQHVRSGQTLHTLNRFDEIRFRTEHEVVDVKNFVNHIIDPDGKGLDYWQQRIQTFLVGVTLHVIYTNRLEDIPATMATMSGLLAAQKWGAEPLWDEMSINKHPVVAAVGQDMKAREFQGRYSVLQSAKSYLALYYEAEQRNRRSV
jgi:SAM-dependent methyltransferase